MCMSTTHHDPIGTLTDFLHGQTVLRFGSRLFERRSNSDPRFFGRLEQAFVCSLGADVRHVPHFPQKMMPLKNQVSWLRCTTPLQLCGVVVLLCGVLVMFVFLIGVVIVIGAVVCVFWCCCVLLSVVVFCVLCIVIGAVVVVIGAVVVLLCVVVGCCVCLVLLWCCCCVVCCVVLCCFVWCGVGVRCPDVIVQLVCIQMS